MRLSINIACFSDIKPIIALKRAISAGFKSVELSGGMLRSLIPSEKNEIKNILTGEGITVSSVNCVSDLMPVILGNLISECIEERQRAIDFVLESIDNAAFLGCQKVVSDLGFSFEDGRSREEQDHVLADSYSDILNKSKETSVTICLLPVAGRRWVADHTPLGHQSGVVEMTVWPWRLWTKPWEINLPQLTEKKLKWAMDITNELISSRNGECKLEEVTEKYLQHGLAVVYLANHPGPFSQSWNRSHLHHSLDKGFFTPDNYQKLLSVLQQENYTGALVIHLSEKSMTENRLKQNLKFIEKISKEL